ncbi:hypothetical protein [Aliidiomarina celeris]|uniref:hypothetical protein n=1 Tax=Aliidiomarina celeris TaxID=2249428 RepID=UPI000DEA544F|nr:hypothetical protein [Aliidiomarina celeris]
MRRISKWYQDFPIKALLVCLCFWLTACASTSANSPAQTSAGPVTLASLTQQDVERLLIRGRTMQHQVAQWFGRPQGVSENGGYQFWNYTESYRDLDAGKSGLVTLTVVFDSNRLVADYDFQANRYTQRK